MSKPIETISFMCGIEIPTLKMLAVGLEWKRIKREWWEVQWFGPYLTTEEMNKEALRQEDIRIERGDKR